MKCPNDRILIMFLDEELTPKDMGRLREHVEGCDACGKRVRELQALRSLVRVGEAAASADEVAEFVALLPDLRGKPRGVAKRLVVVSAVAAAVLVGVFIGSAVRPPAEVVEIHKLAPLAADEVMPALVSLQRLKLAGSSGAAIRDVEKLICGAVSDDGGGTVRAVRLIEEAEDSLAAGDLAKAVVRFGKAAESAPGTEIAGHARLLQARVLAEGLGLYEGAIAKLVALRKDTENDVILREAGRLFTECQMALGDTWGAGMTLGYLARTEGPSKQLAVMAAQLGDHCYDETLDLETAQAAYGIWRDAAADEEDLLRSVRKRDRRLALLEESSQEDWKPLELYLRAERAHPYEAQRLYAELVSDYPDSSLADSAFVKWYGFEQGRGMKESLDRESPTPRGETQMWDTVARSDAPEELRAYARLKIADRLHAELDGVEEVLVAYSDVERDFLLTPAARIAGEKADEVREAIREKGSGL